MSRRFANVLITAAFALSAAIAAAQSPSSAAPAGLPAPSSGSGVAEGGYQEAFCYSAYVRPNFVPGYTPHRSSIYENPREYPSQVGALATPHYLYGRTPGWFFGSPNGYQSSVPPGSHALAYSRGELGITENLSFGYSSGMRVIERVLVPSGQYCRPGGFYISAGSPTMLNTTSGEEADDNAENGYGYGRVAPAVPTPLRPPEK